MPSLGVILRLSPYVAILLAVCWALYERGEVISCSKARVNDILLAERAAREAESKYNERERERTAEIEAKHNIELLRVRQESKSREDAIMRIKTTGARDCAPFDALFDSLRREQGSSGSGDPKAAVR